MSFQPLQCRYVAPEYTSKNVRHHPHDFACFRIVVRFYVNVHTCKNQGMARGVEQSTAASVQTLRSSAFCAQVISVCGLQGISMVTPFI